MSNKKLVFGIIGCGEWGKNFIKVLNDAKDVKLKACSDLNKNRLNFIKSNYPGIKTFCDYKKLLNDKDINCIVVSTPAETHYSLIKEVLLKGKDVLAEKPLTLKTEESEELTEISEDKRRILMVDHIFLYNKSIDKLKQLVRNNTAGKIYYLKSFRTHLGLIRKDVNAIWDLAPHDISIFNYLLDAIPIKVQAFGGCFLDYRREDIGFINFVYPDNIFANVQVSWIDSNKVRRVEVIGSKARLVFDDLDPVERIKVFEKGIATNIKADSFGEFQFNLRDGDIYSPKVEHKEPLKEAINHFIECVRLRKKPLTDGRNGLEIVKVLCAIDRSLKEGNIFVLV